MSSLWRSSSPSYYHCYDHNGSGPSS